MTSSPRSSRRGKRFLLAGLDFLFVLGFQQIYVIWVSPWFQYLGMVNKHPPDLLVAAAFITAVIPAFWMPIDLRRPSQMVYWVMYFCVFVPSALLPPYVGLQEPVESYRLMVALLIGFAIPGVFHQLPLLPLRLPRLSRQQFWAMYWVLAMAFTGWTVVAFWGRMRLVSFADVYDVLRFSSDEVLGKNLLLSYVVDWSGCVIGPWLIAYGLVYRYKLLVVLGSGVQVLMYSVAGGRGLVIAVLAMIVLYAVMRNGARNFGLKMAAVLALTMLLGAAVVERYGDDLNNMAADVVGLGVMRSFAIPGQNTATYYDFFQHHPMTYWSHVHGINFFIEYPYRRQLGEEVGTFYTGSWELDTNAHPFATDGIAALGLYGIPVAGMLVGGLLWLVDAAAGKRNLTFASLLLVSMSVNLSNGGVFTNFLSGGVFMVILFLWIAPDFDKEKRASATKPDRENVGLRFSLLHA